MDNFRSAVERSAEVSITSQIQYCDLCLRRDISTEANSYCQQCDEKLCTDCTGNHKLFKAIKSHQILSINEYKQLPPFIRQIQQYCEEHGDSLEFYCRSHDGVCCKRCMTSSHKHCKDVDVIEDLVTTSGSSIALDKYDETLQDVESNIEIALNNRKSNLGELDTAKEYISKLVGDKKKEINNHLDALERSLLQNLTDIDEMNRQPIVSRIRELEVRQNQATTMRKDIEIVRKHASYVQKFLGTKNIEEPVLNLKKYVQSISDDGSLSQTNTKFKFNSKLQNIPQEVKSFGFLSQSNKDTYPRFSWQEERAAQIYSPRRKSITDIVIKPQERINTKVNGITGCTMMKDGSSLFTMKSNFGRGTVLKYNNSRQLVSRLTLHNSCAFDIVAIDNNTAVVTAGGWGTILHFIDTEQLNINNTVNSGDHLYGVTFYNGEIISGTESNTIIRIAIPVTKVTKTVPISNTLDTYIISDNKYVYHSDLNTNSVVCYDLNGKKQWTYKDPVLDGPRGITIDSSSNVFVAGHDSNNVVVISQDGRQSKQILGPSDGIKWPSAISYDKDSHVLILVNYDGQAFIFNIS